ncbi:MAG: TolC family protein [Duncaniella sp.]|uniref:TolC family protein n=1 Tax=Duncaniella sp. TaxID=2518496 RepID=UPI0023D1AE02|nr:TolC family protein [Duncaniella sp.]MDE6089556.1 TolC family protein [Duncaniella sp.]
MTLSLSGIVAYADETPSQWSYSDCVEYARANNISLRQSQLSEETAAISLEKARGQWQPSLDFGTNQGYSNAPWAKGNSNAYTSSYNLNASWTLWDGGRRESDIRRSQTDVERSRYASDNVMRNIRTELLSTYINILYCKETIAVNSELAEVSRAQADRARQMMESGKISLVDYQQLETQAEQDSYNVVSTTAQLNSARLQLKKLLELGIDTDIDVRPCDFTEAEVTASLPPIDESYQLALSTDALLRYNELSTEMADEDIKAARSSGYPQLSLGAGVGTGYYSNSTGGWGTQMKQGFNENIGLSVSVPIFDRKTTKTAVAQAKVNKLSSQLDTEARRIEVAQTLESWYIDMESSRMRYTAGLQSLKSAKLSDELANEKFKVGYVEPTELLQSHSAVVEAQRELLQAKYMSVLARKMVEFLRTGDITL